MRPNGSHTLEAYAMTADWQRAFDLTAKTIEVSRLLPAHALPLMGANRIKVNEFLKNLRHWKILMCY